MPSQPSEESQWTASDMFKNIQAVVERWSYGGGVAALGVLLILILSLVPRGWLYSWIWLWRQSECSLMISYSSQTVVLCRLLFVLSLSCCHAFGWAEKEEWLTAMERLPVRLQRTVVSLDQAVSHLVFSSSFSVSFCFIGLWPYLEWAKTGKVNADCTRLINSCAWFTMQMTH